MPPHGQVAGPLDAQHPSSPATLGKPLMVPPPPSEYRHLDERYRSLNVASWAEQRICELTGSSCLYSMVALKAGQALAEFGPRAVLKEPNYLTVQVGEHSHIMLSPEWLQYINHSCNPNVFFDTSAFQLLALRDIQAGEELCFFYPSTEWAMDAPFDCRCGAASCCGRISGASQMDRDIVNRYKLSEFIHNKLNGSSGENSPRE